jgi:hypothetical protein
MFQFTSVSHVSIMHLLLSEFFSFFTFLHYFECVEGWEVKVDLSTGKEGGGCSMMLL